jgi:hypothetical protein
MTKDKLNPCNEVEVMRNGFTVVFCLQLNYLKMNVVKKDFYDAVILKTIIEFTEFKGGDAGHGGYVKFNLNMSPFQFEVNGKEVNDITICVRGDAERRTLTDALEHFAKVLQSHP